MKYSLAILTAVAASALAGCQQIPVGSVSEYKRTTTVLGVSSTANLYEIKATERTIKAGSADFVLSFPGFHHQQSVKDLTLAKSKEAPEAKP